MTMKQAVRTIAYFLLLLAGLVYASLGTYGWWKAHLARTDAEILLSEVNKLRLGEATIADVESLARKHKSFLMKGSPSRRGKAQSFDFRYDNRLLRKLRLAPEAIFGISLQFVDGSLDVISVGFESGISSAPYFYRASVWEFPQEAYPGDPGFRLARGDEWISIRLKPSATPEQRKQAYSFNLKCLDKIGGCHDEKELWSGPWETPK